MTHRAVAEAFLAELRDPGAWLGMFRTAPRTVLADALDWLLAQVPPREPARVRHETGDALLVDRELTYRDPEPPREPTTHDEWNDALAERLLVEREPQQTKYAVTATDGLGNVSTVYEIDLPASATPSEPQGDDFSHERHCARLDGKCRNPKDCDRAWCCQYEDSTPSEPPSAEQLFPLRKMPAEGVIEWLAKDIAASCAWTCSGPPEPGDEPCWHRSTAATLRAMLADLAALRAQNEELQGWDIREFWKSVQAIGVAGLSHEDGWTLMPTTVAEQLRAQNEALRTKLADAADDIASWGAYASDYFQKKHDLAGTVAEYRVAALQDEQAAGANDGNV